MPYLIGILLDVSISMEDVFKTFKEDYGDWPGSVFSVVNGLVGKSVSPGNHVFAIGFGAQNASSEFDIPGSLQNFREKYDKTVDQTEYKKRLESFKRYVNLSDLSSVDYIRSIVPFYVLELVSHGLRTSEELKRKFKKFKINPIKKFGYALGYKLTNDEVKSILDEMQTIVVKDDHIKDLLLQDEVQTFDFATAIETIKYWLEYKKMNDESIRGFMLNVEPFIYGSPKLIKTLENSVTIFEQKNYEKHKKILFVLSTGKSTEEDALVEQIKQVKNITRDKNIKIVSCYISRARGNVDPVNHTLFATEKETWDAGARALFNLSSGITTKLLPHAIFRARNWEIEKTNDEIKLFLQINHPQHIQGVCNLASEIVGSQDALLDILGNISLAKYITKTNDEFTAKNQEGETCYANAAAAVLHLAMKRVLNRKDGYPEFEDIRNCLIDKYGEDGANTLTVLTEICPSYRLQCESVEADDAIEAISNGRSLVAIFRLTDEEWSLFSDFFENNPKGILTKTDLDIETRIDGSKTEGHAVVLTSVNSECFRFMNSWGAEWGDLGFFRVKNEMVLDMKLIEVYWKFENLLDEEREYFKTHGASLAKTLLQRFTDLDKKTYACPRCNVLSKVNEFTGSLVEARCPKCKKTFACTDDIVMNLYLSSILQKS